MASWLVGLWRKVMKLTIFVSQKSGEEEVKLLKESVHKSTAYKSKWSA